MLVRANICLQDSKESFVISLPAKWNTELQAAEISDETLERISKARAEAGRCEFDHCDIQFAEIPLVITRRDENRHLLLIVPVPYGDDPAWVLD